MEHRPIVEAGTRELTDMVLDLGCDDPRLPATASWIRQARAGDAAAFEHLVRLHERMVLRVALRLLGRVDLAEDAAQEAFLRMHRHLGRLDETRELGPWLYRVVVNTSHNVSRRHRRSAALSIDELREEPRSSEATATALDEAIALTERRLLVQQALLSLPERERAAITLRDLEGLSTAEVAHILGTTEGTVRSQISTGRLKLKRLLETHRDTRP